MENVTILVEAIGALLGLATATKEIISWMKEPPLEDSYKAFKRRKREKKEKET